MFVIDEVNNITVVDNDANAEGQTFTSEVDLEVLATDWPAARLVDIWNSLPGVTTVKKFTDRATAVRRIYARLNHLTSGAEPAAKPARKVKAAKNGKPKPVAKPKQAAAAKPGKKTAAKTKKAAAAPREGSKKEIVLGLIRRKGGASLEEIMKATDWQAHSVRGFISGALGKKMGLTVESTRTDAGVRTYHLAS